MKQEEINELRELIEKTYLNKTVSKEVWDVVTGYDRGSLNGIDLLKRIIATTAHCLELEATINVYEHKMEMAKGELQVWAGSRDRIYRKYIARGATLASLKKRYKEMKAKAEEEHKAIEELEKTVIEKNQTITKEVKALVDKTNEIISLRNLVEVLKGQVENWKKASQSYAATAREKTDEALRALEREAKVVAEKEYLMGKVERKCEMVERLKAEIEKLYARGLWDRIWNNIPD